MTRWRGALAPLLLAAAMLAASVHLGPDASWDLRNYHIYNPYALLHKAPGTDLLPAQMQSFLPPFPDLPAYWLRLRLNRHPALLDALLALPSAAAVALAFLVARAVLPPESRTWPAVLAAAYGATGAAGLPTTGTVASEMGGGCLVLGGVLLLLRSLDRPRWRPVAAAGALMGVAVAVKLTGVPFVLAAAGAFLLAQRGTAGWRLRCAAWLGAGGAVGAAALGGPWWWHLYQATGNPIFPYYNDVFHSPLNPPIAMSDDRFLPHGVLQGAFYPFFWGFQKTRLVTELVMRDPRVALAYLALLAFAAQAVWRRTVDRAGLYMALVLAVGYALWQGEFAIFRYLAPLEMLSGVAVLLPLRPLLLARPRAVAAGCAALGAFLLLWTRYPDWGRASPANWAVAVAMPPILPGSMVLLLGDDPVGYLAAFAGAETRVVGVNNNLVQPGGATPLAKQVDAAVRGFAGPLYGIDYPTEPKSLASMAYYGLSRAGDCREILSNLDGGVFELCRLQREP